MTLVGKYQAVCLVNEPACGLMPRMSCTPIIPKTSISRAVRAEVALLARQRLQKAKTSPKRKQRGKRNMSAVKSQFLQAQIDPFSDEVDGVGVPDGFSFPTLRGPIRDSIALSSQAALGTTYGALWVTPFLFSHSFAPLSISVGGIVTWAGGTGTNSGQYTGFSTYYPVLRTVAAGLRISCVQALTAATGSLWIAHVPADYAGDISGYTDLPTSEANMAGQPLCEKFPIAELVSRPLVVPFRKLDHSSSRFRDVSVPNSSTGMEDLTGWCGIVIYFTGAVADTPVLNIESVLHVEAIPNKASPIFAGALPVPCAMNELEMANRVVPHIPIGYTVEAGIDSFDRMQNLVARAALTAAKAFNMVQGGYRVYNRLVGRDRPSGSGSYIMYN